MCLYLGTRAVLLYPDGVSRKRMCHLTQARKRDRHGLKTDSDTPTKLVVCDMYGQYDNIKIVVLVMWKLTLSSSFVIMQKTNKQTGLERVNAFTM